MSHYLTVMSHVIMSPFFSPSPFIYNLNLNQLPGFGLPVNYYQGREYPYAFPSSVNQSYFTLGFTTVREFTMMQIINYKLYDRQARLAH